MAELVADAPVATRSFPVIEIFGPTLQGEGILAGRPTYFVRFGGCDFRCTWCDSMYAVEPAEVRANAEKLDASAIAARLEDLPPGPVWVTLSGGNPALLDLEDLCRGLNDRGYRIAVETQGSKWRPWLNRVDSLTVSPKPPSSGMVEKTEAFLPLFLEHVPCPRPYDALKIVVFDERDLEWATEVFRTYPRWQPFLSVGTDQPAGDVAHLTVTHTETLHRMADRYRWLAEAVAGNPDLAGVVVLPQLHVLAFGHARGV